MRGLLLMAVWCAVSLNIFSQPGIGQNGVFNTASGIPPTLAGGALARGALFTITGVRFGSKGHPIVSLTQNGAAIPVHLIQESSNRLRAIVPVSASIGRGFVNVTVDGVTSKPFPVEIVTFNPGIFSRSGEGWGRGLIANLDSHGGRKANSEMNPAQPGQRISLLVTGMGAEKEAAVNIGGRAVKTNAVRNTANPGEQEISVAVPRDAAQGCFVPVYLMASPGRASNVVTMAVKNGPGVCDEGPSPLLTAKRIGLIALSRTSWRAPREGTGDLIDDDAFVSFVEKNNRPLETLVPPAGTCTGYTSTFDSENGFKGSLIDTLLIAQKADRSHATDYDAVPLESGTTLHFERPDPSKPQSAAVRTLEVNNQQFKGKLGNGGPGVRPGMPGLFLGPEEIIIHGAGGHDVPAFTVRLPPPPAFQWIDRDQIKSIDRSRGVTVHWQAAAPSDLILIAAANVDQLTTASATCICAARPSAGSFEIPAALLANFPASQEMPGIPYDRLYVASVKATTGLHVPGIGGVGAWSIFASGRTVIFR